MGTRSGDIDPAVVFYLIENEGMTARDVDIMLNKESGLLGISVVGSDMRDILSEAENGNQKAKLALNICTYSIAKYIGAYISLLPNTDAIVFTAGIGENSSEIRALVVDYLKGTGIKLDPEKNMTRGEICCISTPDSKIPVWIIPTNEELEIAKETVTLIS